MVVRDLSKSGLDSNSYHTGHRRECGKGSLTQKTLGIEVQPEFLSKLSHDYIVNVWMIIFTILTKIQGSTYSHLFWDALCASRCTVWCVSAHSSQSHPYVTEFWNSGVPQSKSVPFTSLPLIPNGKGEENTCELINISISIINTEWWHFTPHVLRT